MAKRVSFQMYAEFIDLYTCEMKSLPFRPLRFREFFHGMIPRLKNGTLDDTYIRHRIEVSRLNACIQHKDAIAYMIKFMIAKLEGLAFREKTSIGAIRFDKDLITKLIARFQLFLNTTDELHRVAYLNHNHLEAT